MNSPRIIWPRLAAGVWLALAGPVLADPRVAVTATAQPDYTARKFASGKTLVESYVFMQGHYFEGITVDHSIERMPFRRIAEYLAPELAKQQYLPTTKAAEADLILVVHWGTTLPYQSQQEMFGAISAVTDTSTSFDTLNRSIRGSLANPDPMDSNAAGSVMMGAGVGGDQITSSLLNISDNSDTSRNMDRMNQLTDAISRDTTRATNLTLLGYNEDMHRLGKALWTTEEERTLRYDLDSERYFIIVQAYALKGRGKTETSRRPLWTMHLNMSSPGNNFREAMERMSQVAVDFVGRTTGEVRSLRPGDREGTVTLAPLIILGEATTK